VASHSELNLMIESACVEKPVSARAVALKLNHQNLITQAEVVLSINK